MHIILLKTVILLFCLIHLHFIMIINLQILTFYWLINIVIIKLAITITAINYQTLKYLKITSKT